MRLRDACGLARLSNDELHAAAVADPAVGAALVHAARRAHRGGVVVSFADWASWSPLEQEALAQAVSGPEPVPQVDDGSAALEAFADRACAGIQTDRADLARRANLGAALTGLEV